MASYTPLLRFVEPSNGDLSWGNTVNNGFTALADAAIAGTATIDVTSSDQTLVPADGASDDARKMVLNITGTPGAPRNVNVPNTSKIYFVKNSSNAAVTVKVSGQTGVSLPANAATALRVDGVDVVEAVTYFGTLGTPLTVPSGGTGVATLTGIVKGNGTSAFSAAIAGTDYTTPSSTETLTNKTIAFASNTLTNVASTNTSQTLTNKTVEAGVFTNGYTEEVVTANTGTTFTIDLSNGSVQNLTLTGNCTYTFPTATAGRSFLLIQKQDATGNRTVTWPASVKWPSSIAPTITSAADKADIFAFTADGSNWFGRVIGQTYL